MKRKSSILSFVVLFPILFTTLLHGAQPEARRSIRIEYLGHASFVIEDRDGNRVVTDPFLDGYPLPFPRLLSADAVAIGTHDPAHDSAYQLRGNPVILQSEQPGAPLGSMKIEPVRITAENEQLGYAIRSGGVTVFFLGEATRELAPDALKLLQEADVVIVAPWSHDSIGKTLRARKKAPLILTMQADSLHPDPDGKELRRFAAGASVRRLRSLEFGASAAPGIVVLQAVSQPKEAPASSIFSGTMAEMTWRQVDLAARAGTLVLLPVAVIEEHGPHMNLTPDTYLAYWHSVDIRRALAARGVKAIVAPPMYWGITNDTSEFPGSFNVRPATMTALLQDIFANLKQWGFRQIVCLNMHGNRTQQKLLADAAAAARKDLGINVYDLAQLDTPVPSLMPPSRSDAYRPDYHAGATETRIIATGLPEAVDTRLARKLEPESGFKPMGYAGDPASFSKETRIPAYWAESAKHDAARIAFVLDQNSRATSKTSTSEATPAQQPGPEVERILAKYIEALGGRQRLESVQFLRRSGSLASGRGKSPVTVQAAAGGKWSIAYTEGRGTRVEAFNGRNGFLSNGQEAGPLPLERIAFLDPLLNIHSAVRLGQSYRSLKLLPDETREGRKLHRISAEIISGVSTELTFDASTGLLHSIGDTIVGDYREVNGVLWPTVIQVGSAYTARFDTVDEKNTIDASVFERPAPADSKANGPAGAR
jgi:creatinine amidohydrolase